MAEPCGECLSCRDLATGGPGSIDVIEIDAASHGGVDDARDLRERAFFAPVNSRYKIYIVDEAHMVTTAGFNALLKLVEEPPPHVKFIFATTEPDKVIGTIRSRTHHYPFRLVPPRVLSDYLAKLCAAEGIEVESGVLPLVVRAGAGSVRDSLSVLDQLLGGASEHGVSYGQAAALLGYTPDSLLDEMLDAFAAGDAGGVFRCVDKVIEVGQDPRRFAEDLLRRVRDLVIVAAVPDALTSGLVEVADDQAERFSTQAASLGAGELTRAGEVLAAGLTEMRGTTAPRLHLELMCARVLLPGTDLDDRGVHARLDRIERRIGMTGTGASAPDAGAPAVPPPTPQPGSHEVRTAAPTGAAVGDTDSSTEQSGPTTAPSGPEAVAAEGSAGPTGTATGIAAPSSDAAPTGSSGPRSGEGPDPRRPGPAESQPKQQQSAEPSGTSSGPAASAGGPPASSEDDWPAPATPGAPSVPDRSDQPADQAVPPSPPQRSTAPAATQPPTQQGTGLTITDLRRLWPEVLEDVKNRRRFTWILLSQNAHVADLTNGTLVLAMPNAGARESFTRGGSEDVLREALITVLGADLRIETMVDPSAGSGGSGRGGGRPPGPPPGGQPPTSGGFPGGEQAVASSSASGQQSGPGPSVGGQSPGPASASSPSGGQAGPAGGFGSEDRNQSGPPSSDRRDSAGSGPAVAGANGVAAPGSGPVGSASSAMSAGSARSALSPSGPPPWAVDGPDSGPDEWEVRDAAADRDDDVLDEAVESHTELLQRRLGAEIIAEEETGA